MRSWLARIVLVALVGGAVAGLFLLPIHPMTSTSTAQGAPTQMHLDLPGPPPPPGAGWPVPPNGSHWHELYPLYCKDWQQINYYDSSSAVPNGLLDPCDNIVLYNTGNGILKEFHIDRVLPTYFLTCFPLDGGPPTPVTMEPATSNPGNNPECEIWHEIWPQYCREVHVNRWVDANGSGVLDPCDYVYLKGGPGEPEVRYHLDRIGCDIIITEKIPTKARQGTWGWLKSMFRK